MALASLVCGDSTGAIILSGDAFRIKLHWRNVDVCVIFREIYMKMRLMVPAGMHINHFDYDIVEYKQLRQITRPILHYHFITYLIRCQ